MWSEQHRHNTCEARRTGVSNSYNMHRILGIVGDGETAGGCSSGTDLPAILAPTILSLTNGRLGKEMTKFNTRYSTHNP